MTQNDSIAPELLAEVEHGSALIAQAREAHARRAERALMAVARRIHESRRAEAAPVIRESARLMAMRVREGNEPGLDAEIASFINRARPLENPVREVSEIERIEGRLVDLGYHALEREAIAAEVKRLGPGAHVTAIDGRSVTIGDRRYTRDELREMTIPLWAVDNPMFFRDKWLSQFPRFDAPAA